MSIEEWRCIWRPFLMVLGVDEMDEVEGGQVFPRRLSFELGGS